MWRKASNCSAANCLEADGPWRKADASNPSGNCVEVLPEQGDGLIRVRDTKQGDTSPVLVFPIGAWDDGRVIDFIPAAGTDQYMVIGVTEAGEQAALFFTQGEVDAFLQGIKDDDFVPAGR
jgi:hypothetical protein